MEHLAKLPQVHLYPTRRGYIDYFGQEDAEKVEQLEIDVLLRHHFGIIRGPILSAPKHGIWSYHHSDNAVIRGMPEGFWEIYHNHPVTGATLQILTDEVDGGQVMIKCSFRLGSSGLPIDTVSTNNRHPSCSSI